MGITAGNQSRGGAYNQIAGEAQSGTLGFLVDNTKDFTGLNLVGKTVGIVIGDKTYYRDILDATGDTLTFSLLPVAVSSTVTLSGSGDTIYTGGVVIQIVAPGVAGNAYSVELVAGTGISAVESVSLVGNVLTITSGTTVEEIPTPIAAGNIQSLINNTAGVNEVFEVVAEIVAGSIEFTDEAVQFSGGTEAVVVSEGTKYFIWNDENALTEIVNDLTTGGADKIASAETVKTLDGKITNLATNKDEATEGDVLISNGDGTSTFGRSNSDLIEEGDNHLFHTDERVVKSSKNPIYNTNHLFNTHKQLSKMETANEKLKVLIHGDSISVGAFAANPLTLESQEQLSYFGLLNEYYKSKYTTTNTLFKSIYSQAATGYWTRTGTWTFTAEATGNGHYRNGYRTLVGGDYATCVFNGTSIDVLFIKDALGATADIYIDDELNSSVNLDLAAGVWYTLYVKTISGLTDEEHTVKIVNTLNGKYMDIMGLVETGYAKGIEITNLAFGGSRTVDIQGNYATYITHKAYDLTIFAYLYNDVAYTTGIETYKTNLRNFVTSALGNKSDVILLALGATTGTGDTALSYLEAMRSVAVEKDVCMVDTVSRWVSGKTSGNIAQLIDDGTHPNAYGHRDIFRTLIQAFES